MAGLRWPLTFFFKAQNLNITRKEVLFLSLHDGLVKFITLCWTSSVGVSTAQKALEFSPDDAEIVNAFLNVIAPIGITLIAVFFMIGLFRDMSNERDTDIHVLVRAGLFLIVADLVIMYSPVIIGSLMSLANSFMKEIDTLIGGFGSDAATNPNTSITQELSQSGIVTLIFMAITSAIGWLLGIIGGAIIFIVCVSAKIELMLRFIFAPIGISAIAEGGHGMNEGFRYLKKLFASALSFGAVIIVIFITNRMGSSYFLKADFEWNDWAGFIVSYITNAIYTCALPLAAAGTISIVKQIINEAFGV